MPIRIVNKIKGVKLVPLKRVLICFDTSKLILINLFNLNYFL